MGSPSTAAEIVNTAAEIVNTAAAIADTMRQSIRSGRIIADTGSWPRKSWDGLCMDRMKKVLMEQKRLLRKDFF